MSYPGVYRAQCVSVTKGRITAYIPQVFGDNPIPIVNRTGALPKPKDRGWVVFESAMASLPVWVSSSGGTPTSAASALQSDESEHLYDLGTANPSGAGAVSASITAPQDGLYYLAVNSAITFSGSFSGFGGAAMVVSSSMSPAAGNTGAAPSSGTGTLLRSCSRLYPLSEGDTVTGITSWSTGPTQLKVFIDGYRLGSG